MGCRQKSKAEPRVLALFEEYAGLYSLFREHLFTDHTPIIVESLFSCGETSRESLLEVGCGPGYYSRQIAKLYPEMQIIGLDRSSKLVERAKDLAKREGAANCLFQQEDARDFSLRIAPVDAVICSRLMLVVEDRFRVMQEIFQVLKPGGRLFLAEPTSGIKTLLPLLVMRLCAFAARPLQQWDHRHVARILDTGEFDSLIRSQPWASVRIARGGQYQYAVCTKSPGNQGASDSSPECFNFSRTPTPLRTWSDAVSNT